MGKLNIGMNANEKTNLSYSEELIKREAMDSNPFQAIWTEKTDWFAALGQFRITDSFETKEKLEKFLNEKNWETIMSIASVLIELNKK